MPKEQTVVKRIPYIDSLKGFAILCVVLGHIANGHMWDPEADPAYFVIYNVIYSFHMPLFIMLSGYVFRKSCFEPGTGTVRKEKTASQILNLTILYFLWSILLGLFKIIFGGFVNNPITWITLCLIPVQPIQLYWYLFVLIVYYVVFGILNAGRVRPSIMLPVTFCLAVLSTWIPPNLVFDVKRVLYYAFFFAFGFSLDFLEKRFREKVSSPWRALLLLAFFVIAVILCIVFWNPAVFLHDRMLVNVLAGLAISLGLYACFQKWFWLGKNRFLIYLGKRCLEIYLLHTFLLSASRVLLEKLHLQSTFIMILAEFAAGVFLPLLISFICRKIHIYRFFFAPYPFRTQKDKPL
ncbi:MAG: acyltransferase [Parasporobacterium sp.]|nr:acyltransferase [Parasporobacterium sp.]